jgi:hypothetical protein
MYIESSQESGEIPQQVPRSLRPLCATKRPNIFSMYHIDIGNSYFGLKTREYNPKITNDTMQKSVSYILKNPSLYSDWSNWKIHTNENVIIHRPRNEDQFKIFLDFLMYCSIVDKCWNAGDSFDIQKTLQHVFRFLSHAEICQHEIFLIQHGIEYDF